MIVLDVFCLQCAYNMLTSRNEGLMKLTKKIVENTPLPNTGQTFLWDDDLKGFGLRLTPTARTYVVQARVNRKTRRVSIGKHGVLTLQDARKEAVKELSNMLKGKDPTVEKARMVAQKTTLDELAEEYIKARRELKESSIYDIRKHMKSSFSVWAKKPAVNITRDKVATLHRELTEKSPAQANQAFRILRALFNYARAKFRPDGKPLILENPVSILSDAKLWNRVKPRSGRIPNDKVGAAWNYLRSVRGAPGETMIIHTTADILSFLLLTGARWSEAAKLLWDNVNLEEKWWYIPDPKNTNPVTFPLSDQAVKILEDRPKINKYVFPSRNTKVAPIHDGRGLVGKLSENIGIPVTPHDLRRTFRAIAGECNIELWRTKLLMNHKLSGDVTIHSYTETSDLRYLSTEINKIADWIIRQGVIAASENVIMISHISKQGVNCGQKISS